MKVRALVDIPGTGIKSGEFFEAPAPVAKGLVAAGDADDKATEEVVYAGGEIPSAKQHPALEAVKADPKTTDKK